MERAASRTEPSAEGMESSDEAMESPDCCAPNECWDIGGRSGFKLAAFAAAAQRLSGCWRWWQSASSTLRGGACPKLPRFCRIWIGGFLRFEVLGAANKRSLCALPLGDELDAVAAARSAKGLPRGAHAVAATAGFASRFLFLLMPSAAATATGTDDDAVSGSIAESGGALDFRDFFGFDELRDDLLGREALDDLLDLELFAAFSDLLDFSDLVLRWLFLEDTDSALTAEAVDEVEPAEATEHALDPSEGVLESEGGDKNIASIAGPLPFDRFLFALCFRFDFGRAPAVDAAPAAALRVFLGRALELRAFSECSGCSAGGGVGGGCKMGVLGVESLDPPPFGGGGGGGAFGGGDVAEAQSLRFPERFDIFSVFGAFAVAFDRGARSRSLFWRRRFGCNLPPLLFLSLGDALSFERLGRGALAVGGGRGDEEAVGGDVLALFLCDGECREWSSLVLEAPPDDDAECGCAVGLGNGSRVGWLRSTASRMM